jgi:hypothetical protein
MRFLDNNHQVFLPLQEDYIIIFVQMQMMNPLFVGFYMMGLIVIPFPIPLTPPTYPPFGYLLYKAHYYGKIVLHSNCPFFTQLDNIATVHLSFYMIQVVMRSRQ